MHSSQIVYIFYYYSSFFTLELKAFQYVVLYYIYYLSDK